jgi:hypothetical protein
MNITIRRVLLFVIVIITIITKKVAAAFDRKIELVKEGLQPYISNYFKIY